MSLLLGALALLGAARITELVVSSRNWKTHRAYANRPKEVVFPWMVALHSSVFVLLPTEMLVFGGEQGGMLSTIALLMTLGALGLRFWTLNTIGRSWNVAVVGGPKYPIVDSGPYRYIRHPNYLVVCLELACIPLIWELWRSALLLTLCNALVLSKRIMGEEQMLAQNPEWVARMAHKPRFIPKWGGSGTQPGM